MFHFNLINDFKTVSEIRETFSSSIDRIKDTKKPLVITQQGKPAAVLLDVESFNKMTEDYIVIAGILQGLKDVKDGRLMSTDSLKESLVKDGKLDKKSRGRSSENS